MIYASLTRKNNLIITSQQHDAGRHVRGPRATFERPDDQLRLGPRVPVQNRVPARPVQNNQKVRSDRLQRPRNVQREETGIYAGNCFLYS